MNKTLKIGMGCGLGAFFGNVVANCLFPAYSILGLILGMVFGGFLATFVYALEDIAHFAPIVWRQVMGWKPKSVDWKIVNLRIRIIGASIGSCLSVLLVFCVLGLFTNTHFKYICLVGFSAGGLIGFFYCVFTPKSILPEFLRLLEIPLSLKWNVFCAPFSAIYYFLKGVLWCLKWLSDNSGVIKLFILKLFILAGSEGLRCCFIDTAIAVAIGWMLNLTSPAGLLFGGLIGVAIGTFHYKVVEGMPSAFKRQFGS